MRTTLLILSFVFIGGAVNAQITKGSKLIGGNLSLGNGKVESEAQPHKNTTSSFYIFPSFGVAVKDNLIAGVKLGYGNSTNNYSDNQVESKEKSNNYTVGIFVRQYKQLGKSDFYLFGDAGANYSKRKQTNVTTTQENIKRNEDQYSISITPGISYAVNKRLHLELSMADLFRAGFSNFKETTSSLPGIRYNSRNTFASINASNITNSLSFGLRFLLAK